jgi:hypothetical protein
MVHSERLEWLDLIKAAYPNGQETRLYSADPALADDFTHHQPVRDPLMWVAYRVGADDVAAHGGLRLTVRDATGASVELRATSISPPVPLPTNLTYPIDLEWRGWFHSDPIDEEPFTLYSAGSVVPTLRLADQRIDLASGSARVRLPLGGQPLLATARLNAPSDTVLVEWDGLQRHTRQPFALGQASVWPGEPRLTVDWLTRDGSRQLRRDYDVMIADWNLQFRHPTPDPVMLRWSGQLQIDRSGTREFELGGDGPVRLLIDGRQLWPAEAGKHERPGGPPETRRARVALEPGRHQIVLERIKTEGSQVVLFWRERDEPFTVVPRDAFVPLTWPSPG